MYMNRPSTNFELRVSSVPRVQVFESIKDMNSIPL